MRVALATGLGLGLFGGVAFAQFSPATSVAGSGGSSTSPAIFKGTVLNRVTRAPVGRALVFSADQQLAMMTDDRGHFEFKTGTVSNGDSGGIDGAKPGSDGQFHQTGRAIFLPGSTVEKIGHGLLGGHRGIVA